MSLPLLVALTGAAWESTLLTALARPGGGIEVVRRCVDVPDLLATAATGQGRAVLVAADLHRFDEAAIERLHVAGLAVVVVVVDPAATTPDRWRSVGADDAVSVGDAPDLLAPAVTSAVVAAVARRSSGGVARGGGLHGVGGDRVGGDGVGDDRGGDQGSRAAPGRRGLEDTVWADPAFALGATPHAEVAGGRAGDADEPPSTGSRHGRLVAVWGPAGAPGRTTLAVNLAAETAAAGVLTLLADADVYGGVVAQMLGLLDESAGLAAATRLAAGASAGGGAGAGRGLDLPALARLAPLASERLRVLTGIPRADRWPELRPGAVETVWALARQLADLVVVDCGFSLERDEELTFDTLAPRRNGATLVTLEHADVVLAVARADPVGLARFARALPELREAAPTASVRVIVTQVRRSVLGPDPRGQVLAALDRYAGVRDPVLLPDDRPAVDRALARGQSLAEAAPGSPLRHAVASLAADIAADLVPADARAAAGRAHRRPRRTRRARTAPAPALLPERQSLL